MLDGHSIMWNGKCVVGVFGLGAIHLNPFLDNL